jgi:hypothetical protein
MRCKSLPLSRQLKCAGQSLCVSLLVSLNLGWFASILHVVPLDARERCDTVLLPSRDSDACLITSQYGSCTCAPHARRSRTYYELSMHSVELYDDGLPCSETFMHCNPIVYAVTS